MSDGDIHATMTLALPTSFVCDDSALASEDAGERGVVPTDSNLRVTGAHQPVGGGSSLSAEPGGSVGV